jgi:hypothetical protein
VRSVPEEFEQIHIPLRVRKSMEDRGIPVLDVTNTIHTPDRVSIGRVPGRLVAERALEGGASIRVAYSVRRRPPEPYDAEWAEIVAERAVEIAAHTVDGGAGAAGLDSAVVVKEVVRENGYAR